MNPMILDEQTVRRYLLGQLAEHERDEFEERLITDGDSRDEVEATERDLIDDYVHDNLTEDERARFERMFLPSASRRQKITFARALANTTSEHVAEVPTLRTAKFAALLTRVRPPLRLAFAAVVLLVFAGVLWVILDRRESSVEHQTSTPPMNATPQNTNSQVAVQQAEPSPTPVSRSQNDSASIASFLLLPGAERSSDEVRAVTIPPGVTTIRFQLSLSGLPNLEDVRAELRKESPEGSLVFSTGTIRPRSSSQGPYVVLELPSSRLSPGKYVALLKGTDNEIEAIYAFSVRGR